MKYDIYFHNDFDGRASAAVMLNFLETRGDSIARWIPVEYGTKWIGAKLAPSEKRNPAIVADFSYHPEAAFWFDHHETAFKKPEWRKKFRQTKYRVWDPKAPSACGLIVKSLKKNFGYKPPRHILELAKWLDIIDMAGFHSARQAIEKKEPALQIEEFIDGKKGKETLRWLIEAMSRKSLAEVARMPAIKKSAQAYQKRKKATLKFYRKDLKILGRVGFIDISKSGPDARFAPYYLCPKLLYAMTLKKDINGNFRISFNANAWRRKENKIHIGKYLWDHFGGGGHHDAGGAEFASRELAEKAAQKIIERFK